ncbi:MAG: helix-turn-helix domain-containing protein [Planctomycetes bacterium]|nr:helix-turn-helix domain-containing protein [Planctomycetota bacterium]
MNTTATESLITPSEAARYLRVSEGTLTVWRCTGRHALPFVKVGRRVMYRRDALDRWIDARTSTSTSALDADPC